MMLCAAIVSFVSVHVFIIPSNFAPSGIEGISAILHEITDINIGWFKLLLNIPLLILAWVCLDKRYVFYVIGFVLCDAVGVILLEKLDFYTLNYTGRNAIHNHRTGYRKHFGAHA